MRQKTLLCIMGLSAVLFTGCSGRQSQMNYIGAESAKQTALEAASLSEQEVSSISTDMSTRNGLDYYRICFEAAGQSYQYNVDALTGVIICAEGPTGTGSSQSGQTDLVEVEQPKTDNPGTGGASLNQPVKTPVQDSGSEDYIGEEEARRAALEHAGLEEDQVTFVSSVLEFDDGQWEYDVEFYTANYEEYDYEIDAYTGAVISFDYDAEYYSPQTKDSGTITTEQAKQLALDQVPGAAEGDIRKFKVDTDDGILLYEGKIIYSGMEYEFEIDAYSGTIREWSAEPFAR